MRGRRGGRGVGRRTGTQGPEGAARRASGLRHRLRAAPSSPARWTQPCPKAEAWVAGGWGAQPEKTSSGRVIQYNVLILGNKIDRPGRSRRGRAEVGLFPIEIESLWYLLCKTAAIKFVRDRYRYISK